MVATGLFGIVASALVIFTSTSVRLVIRNLSTNHSHDVVRVGGAKVLADLHAASSRYRLMSFNGTSYTDATPVVTSDQDVLTQQYVSSRTNGVRFYRNAGGPFKISSNVSSSATSLDFDFSVGGIVTYVPQTGDRVRLPLLDREFGISAVTVVPTNGSPQGRITIDDPDGVGFTITTGTGMETIGYFYRKAAYTVFNQELRYHENFQGSQAGIYKVVRSNVTSPKPFGLLYPTSTSLTSDALNLRVSLESADADYSQRAMLGSTVTLQTVIPARTQPPEITKND